MKYKTWKLLSILFLLNYTPGRISFIKSDRDINNVMWTNLLSFFKRTNLIYNRHTHTVQFLADTSFFHQWDSTMQSRGISSSHEGALINGTLCCSCELPSLNWREKNKERTTRDFKPTLVPIDKGCRWLGSSWWLVTYLLRGNKNMKIKINYKISIYFKK